MAPVTLTYMHLRVKFLCRRPGGISPSDVVLPEIVGAVWRVPHVVAVGPGQDAGEGRVEVEEGPGDDGVVVEGHVQRNDTYCVSNACSRGERWSRMTITQSIALGLFSLANQGCIITSPLKMGQMCFHMEMAPVLWNCPSASSM